VRRRDVLAVLIAGYALAHIGLGGWQLLSPRSFFDAIGPFGSLNSHYVRDVGTFTLALGIAFAVAFRWPAWRVGVIGYAFLQYAFHALNHLADIGKAHPHAVGPVDFATIALTAGLLAWMLVAAVRERRVPAS
jgi:hypothetical protein